MSEKKPDRNEQEAPQWKLLELEIEVNQLRAQIEKLRAQQNKTDPAALQIRREILTALKKLLPEALRQARKGKPALLRLISRAAK